MDRELEKPRAPPFKGVTSRAATSALPTVWARTDELPVGGVACGNQLRIEALKPRKLHKLNERCGYFANVDILGPQGVTQCWLPPEVELSRAVWCACGFQERDEYGIQISWNFALLRRHVNHPQQLCAPRNRKSESCAAADSRRTVRTEPAGDSPLTKGRPYSGC